MDPTGTRLKKLRIEKGISLEEIQKKTRIHPNILRAIEGDAITNLSPVYLKSFLKIYCKFLDVDYREYLGDYKVVEAAGGQRQEFVPSPKQAPAKQPAPQRFMKSAPVKINRLWPGKKAVKNFVIVIAILFLLLGLFKLGGIIFSGRRVVKPAQQVKQPPQKPKAIPAAPKVKPQNADKGKAQNVSEIRLGIRANDNCWVTLKVDGKIVFQRVLAKGRFESWKAKDKMELSLGNAGAVELEVNGQLFSNLGRKNQQLKNIMITREGMNIPR